MIANQIFKMSKLLAPTKVYHISQNKFANIKVKIDYCKGCEFETMLELVERELYNEYRRTFGDHHIVIQGNKSNEYDGRFVIDLKIDETENQRIWDTRKQGGLHDDNVNKLTQIIDKRLLELKPKKQ